MFSTALFYRKQTLQLAGLYLGAAGINIVLNLLFIPHWGIVGAALATTTSYLLLCVLTLTLAQRHYYIPYRYWEIIISVGVAVGLFILVTVYLPGAVLDKVGAVVIYGLILFLLRVVNRRDLLRIRELFSKSS